MTQEISEERKELSAEEKEELVKRIIKGEATEEEKEALLKRVQRKAMKLKYRYGGCGQVPLQALIEEFNLPGGTAAFKSMTFTGYGLAAELDICAALLGAFAAIGLWAGRLKLDESIYPDPENIDETTGNPKTLEKLRAFYQRFKEEYGDCTSCRDIQEELFDRVYELAVPKEKKLFIELYAPDCAELVGTTARMAAEVMLDIPARLEL